MSRTTVDSENPTPHVARTQRGCVTGNGGTTAAGSQIIANNMKVTGNGPVTVSYTGNGAPVRDTRIVE
jgi:hypothetical protein